MKVYKKDNSYKKVFEGKEKDLEKYFSNTYYDTIENYFGSLNTLEIGKQMDDVTLAFIIFRKEKNRFIMFTKFKESIGCKDNIFPG